MARSGHPEEGAGMTHARRVAASLITAGVLGITLAWGAPAPAPAADPRTVELIHELALPESSTALREQAGWRPPRRIVMATGNPNGTSAAQQIDSLKAVAAGVEIVAVADADAL